MCRLGQELSAVIRVYFSSLELAASTNDDDENQSADLDIREIGKEGKKEDDRPFSPNETCDD